MKSLDFKLFPGAYFILPVFTKLIIMLNNAKKKSPSFFSFFFVDETNFVFFDIR